MNKSFSLHRTHKRLPEWIEQVQASKKSSAVKPSGKKIVIFTTLRYWVEHSILLSLALSGLGHDVTLSYLPYNNWRSRINRFDLRRQNLYANKVLHPAQALIHPVSFLDVSNPAKNLPSTLQDAIEEVSVRDTQYTLQVEDIDRRSDLFRLRIERNTQAALAALKWLQGNRPDVLVTPNGSILEMGAVYQVARYLEIPLVTYEFGEQRERIWLAQNDEVMLQHTDDLWMAFRESTPRTGRVRTDPGTVCIAPAGQPVGEFLPPLARTTITGRRTGAPDAQPG